MKHLGAPVSQGPNSTRACSHGGVGRGGKAARQAMLPAFLPPIPAPQAPWRSPGAPGVSRPHAEVYLRTLGPRAGRGGAVVMRQ